MNTITQRIYIDDMATANHWIGKMGLKSFADLIHEWVKSVDMKYKEDFYKKLSPIRPNITRPLSGCRIDKKRICIQKKSASYK